MTGIQGLPLFWRNETSGRLAIAIHSYLKDQTRGEPISREDFDLVREYIEQWVFAPCWTEVVRTVGSGNPDLTAELVQLRADVRTLKTADEIHVWLMRALDLGIDPL
jgi:hypothetical protein